MGEKNDSWGWTLVQPKQNLAALEVAYGQQPTNWEGCVHALPTTVPSPLPQKLCHQQPIVASLLRKLNFRSSAKDAAFGWRFWTWTGQHSLALLKAWTRSWNSWLNFRWKKRSPGLMHCFVLVTSWLHKARFPLAFCLGTPWRLGYASTATECDTLARRS